MITIPSLNDVTDILDTDMIMVTQQSGQSYKISGSELNKRGKIIIASSTTITGAPLKAGSSVRVYFTVDLTAANASTTLQLNYNNVNYYVKAPKDGTLINFVATNLGGSPAVYKYLQKYTTLELLFDGTQFVIIGNPVILSSADYTIYADGLKRIDVIEDNNKNMITSNAVANAFGNWTVLCSGLNWSIRGIVTKNGKYLALHMQGARFTNGEELMHSVPDIFVPSNTTRMLFFDLYNDTRNLGFINITNAINIYPANSDVSCYGDCLVKIA